MNVDSDDRTTRTSWHSHRRVLVAVVVVVFIVVSVVASQPILNSIYATTPSKPGATGGSGPGNFEPQQVVPPTVVYAPPQLTDPDFGPGGVSISEPAGYSQLVQYALGLINADRNGSGAAPVTLSAVLSGQQHADSLAYHGTFGHWDVQGYKPYMRYTLLGGQGSVEENAYLNYCTYSPVETGSVFPVGCNIRTIENGIANAEAGLMDRDAACCNNGHRDNILDPFHDSVSIGIAYNSTTDALYLVQDFENSYITSESLQLSGSAVALQGSTQQDLTGWTGATSGALIVVYYDPPPVPIADDELTISQSCLQYNELYEPASCQYRGGYGPGTEVNQVFATCATGYTCGPPGYVYAQQWTLSKSGSFKIVISMTKMEAEFGPGIYTLYLHPSGRTNETITSLSVFVPGT